MYQIPLHFIKFSLLKDLSLLKVKDITLIFVKILG